MCSEGRCLFVSLIGSRGGAKEFDNPPFIPEVLPRPALRSQTLISQTNLTLLLFLRSASRCSSFSDDAPQTQSFSPFSSCSSRQTSFFKRAFAYSWTILSYPGLFFFWVLACIKRIVHLKVKKKSHLLMSAVPANRECSQSVLGRFSQSSFKSNVPVMVAKWSNGKLGILSVQRTFRKSVFIT